MHARYALLGLAVLAAGCGAARPAAAPERTGPPGVARIALARVPWPLDPARLAGRDETQLGRALLATPYRVDGRGRLRPGLCVAALTFDYRTWTLACRFAPLIAAELRRLRDTPSLPSHWLVADATRIDGRGSRLVLEFRGRRQRVPWLLSAVAAAPRGVPGEFRVVTARPGQIVAARPGLRLVFRQMDPHAAAIAFRRGRLDEAPVALGDIQAALHAPTLAGTVHVRELLGVDLVAFRMPGRIGPGLRRIYWQTADRAGYDGLVPELEAPAAYGLIRDASKRGGAAAARKARGRVGALEPPALAVGAAKDADSVYEAELAAAPWRDAGLGATVRPGAPGEATFERVLAPYPLPEALLGQVILGLYPDSGPARTLRRALGGAPAFRAADDALQEEAAIVPLARVADARLVSPRLRGWRRDRLGLVDYTEVRAPASSRPRSR